MATKPVILTSPEFLRVIRAHFPTATAVVVESPQRVLVRCGHEPDWSGWGRRSMGGTAILGSSPATAELAAQAVVLANM